MKTTPYVKALVVAVIVLPRVLTAEVGTFTNDAPVRGAPSAERFVNYYNNLSNVAKVAVSSARLANATNSLKRAAGHHEGRPVDLDKMGIMKRSLGLNDDQASKLESALKEQQDKIDALRRDASLSRQARSARLREIEAGTDAKIMALLTPEQAQRWQDRSWRSQLFVQQGTKAAKVGWTLRREPKSGPPANSTQDMQAQPPHLPAEPGSGK